MVNRVKEDFINYASTTYSAEGVPLHTTKALSIGYMLGYNVLPSGIAVGSTESVYPVMTAIADTVRLVNEARADGMATQVGDLAVDFTTHLARLTAEGSKQVHVLSMMVGIPVKVNIFTGQVPTSRNTQYQVRSTPHLEESPYNTLWNMRYRLW